MNDGEGIFDGEHHNQQKSSDEDVNNSITFSSCAESDGMGKFRNTYINEHAQMQKFGQVYVKPTQFYVSAVTCEMCGTKGTTETFFSRSKRFCSVSCSRSYSSNAKKSSILARLQVEMSGKVFFAHIYSNSDLIVVCLCTQGRPPTKKSSHKLSLKSQTEASHSKANEQYKDSRAFGQDGEKKHNYLRFTTVSYTNIYISMCYCLCPSYFGWV